MRRMVGMLVVQLVWLGSGSTAWAEPGGTDVRPQPGAPPASEGSRRLVELPETTVIGKPLREDAPLGPNLQPEWTARRRFAETRIYVLPPWQLSLYTTWQLTKLRDAGEEPGD